MASKENTNLGVLSKPEACIDKVIPLVELVETVNGQLSLRQRHYCAMLAVAVIRTSIRLSW